MRMLLLKTWRDLLARKGQFGALVVLVALGIRRFVAFLTGYLDLTKSVESANTELKFADFSTSVMAAPTGEVAASRGCRACSPSRGGSSSTSRLDVGDGTKAKARIVGVPDERAAPRRRPPACESGRTGPKRAATRCCST